MSEIVDFDTLLGTIAHRGVSQRHITAIGGAPGSGKSTVAARIAEALNSNHPGSAAVLPMDGFHFDDAVLNVRGDRPRKGAPHTFDVGGLSHMLGRLAAREDDVAVPVFDRDIEIARAGARIIPAATRHIIAEGNYLLLDKEPWTSLAPHFGTEVYLDVPLSVLTRRLEKRWAWMPEDDRRAKLEENDLPNARLVTSSTRAVEFVLKNAGGAEVARVT